MKRIVLALLASTALAASASAADLTPRRVLKAAPLEAFSWTGLYIGGHVGAGWSTTESRLDDISINGVSVGGLNLPLASHTGNGFLGGGQVGFNYQLGTLVLGIEADGTYTDLKGSAPCLVVLTCTDKTKWMATAAGRVGFAYEHTMIYLKGGAAWAKHDHNVNLSLAGVTLDASGSSTRTGWLIGTGVEQALGYGWSAKVEYNYIDFGSNSLNLPVNITGAGVLPPITAATSFNEQTHVVKGGINYRFGGN